MGAAALKDAKAESLSGEDLMVHQAAMVLSDIKVTPAGQGA
jgi:hypothetical protein